MSLLCSFVSNASLIFVDLIPFLCLLMCLLSVAGAWSRGYFPTALAVNPGHVVSCFFQLPSSACFLEDKTSIDVSI